jgi:hypothetical protein
MVRVYADGDRFDTRAKDERVMYGNHPTELYYERHELLLREAREARLARRAARRKAGNGLVGGGLRQLSSGHRSTEGV